MAAMASKLLQLQSKACLATQFVSKHGTTYYKQLLEQNKQYIQELATVEKCRELSKRLFYTRLARKIKLEKPLWSWSLLKRKCNAAADWLAMRAKMGVDLGDWINQPPLSLMKVLKTDGLPAPPLLD